MNSLSLKDASSLTAGASMWTTMAVPHAQIASLKMADGPMGIAGSRVDERDVSILTPAPIALGATWDISLVARIGQLVGGEAIRTAINLVLAPNLNLARSPLAGRCFEYFGEDPFHVGLLGTAWASGIQSQGIGAIAKHLVCNDSETGRDVMNAVVDERTLHEVYLLPFEMAAKDDCAGILTAYNRINGAWCSEASDVIVKIAKEQWGYRGMFMSDWFGTHSTVGSLNGGLDLEMPGPARFLGAKAMQAVEQGETAADRVHDAALRIARTAVRFSNASGTPLSKDASKALLIETAAAGFTLLRNKGALLPLVPGRQQRIAVIGPNASMPCFQGGTFAKIALKSDAVTPLDAIMARYEGHAIIEYAPGVDPQPRLPRMSVVPKRDLGDNCHSGMTIDYFADQDFDSAPVASETRNTNSLTWFFGVHDAGAFQQPAGTLAQGIFTATHGGDHIFYLGGTGAVRMLIDGREILRRDDIPAAKDVMGRLKSGEADSVAIRLIAGQKIEVKAEMRYSPARAQGLWFGIRPPGTEAAMIAEAVALAARSDAVLLIVGETADASVESKDREDTKLPADQIRLIEAVTTANPHCGIIANVGHAIDTSWDSRAAALMIAWYPGEEFGKALAQVIAGDRDPGGRLPVSFAAKEADYTAFSLDPEPNGDLVYAEGTRIGYRGLAMAGTKAQYAFGAGLSYARIEWSAPLISATSNGGLMLSLTLHNVSDCPGSEVVQVYRDTPELTLIGFAKAHLRPGEKREVTIDIARRRLQTWHGAWVDIPGAVTFHLARSAEILMFDLRL